MKRMPVNYSIPKVTNSTFDIASLNISKEDFIIGLPHTLFKYHPDFDEILDKVLEEIPQRLRRDLVQRRRELTAPQVLG